MDVDVHGDPAADPGASRRAGDRRRHPAALAHPALPEQFGLPHVAQSEVLLLEARDQVQEAAALARRNWHRALDHGRRIWPLVAGVDTIRVARAANDRELVARVANDTAAVPVAHARALAPAARLVAAVAADSAREATAAALDYRAIGNVPGEVAAWEEAACLTAAGGAAEDARTVAARCTALAAALGATTVERRVSARLRQLDVRLVPTQAVVAPAPAGKA